MLSSWLGTRALLVLLLRDMNSTRPFQLVGYRSGREPLLRIQESVRGAQLVERKDEREPFPIDHYITQICGSWETNEAVVTIRVDCLVLL
jgi:hypothetical protein